MTDLSEIKWNQKILCLVGGWGFVGLFPWVFTPEPVFCNSFAIHSVLRAQERVSFFWIYQFIFGLRQLVH